MTPATTLLTPDVEEGDLTTRAAALVNPASGLANDYLNVFNEIVMMIDLLPDMSDLASEIETWSPVTYRAYFTRSNLAGREGALSSYDRLEPGFRKAFERCAADLSRAARAACANVLDLCLQKNDGDGNDALQRACQAQAHRLRGKLERLTEMVNGHRTFEAA